MGFVFNKRHPKGPCLGCENREVGCHGKCELYGKWRSILDDINQEDREYNRATYVEYGPRGSTSVVQSSRDKKNNR